MQTLDTRDDTAIEQAAHRHGFSVDATRTMLDAIVRGNGSMAQFSHPEFGGSGQWMRGGMTMVADLFNHRLKTAVDGLCTDLSRLIAERSVPARSVGSFQSQRQGGTEAGERRSEDSRRDAELAGGTQFGSAAGRWWPADFGMPNASGAQNGTRYAYFAGPRRLAIEVNGALTVYDTETHRISGVSQQQSGSGSMSFSSQHGAVDLSRLRRVSESEARVAGTAAAEEPEPSMSPQVTPAASAPERSAVDVPSLIGKLAALHAEGILTDAEFSTKKAELLGRI